MPDTITPPRPQHTWPIYYDDLERLYHSLRVAHHGRVLQLDVWKDRPHASHSIWHASVVDLASGHFRTAEHATRRDAKAWCEQVAPEIACSGLTTLFGKPAGTYRVVSDVSYVLRQSTYTSTAT